MSKVYLDVIDLIILKLLWNSELKCEKRYLSCLVQLYFLFILIAIFQWVSSLWRDSYSGPSKRRPSKIVFSNADKKHLAIVSTTIPMYRCVSWITEQSLRNLHICANMLGQRILKIRTKVRWIIYTIHLSVHVTIYPSIHVSIYLSHPSQLCPLYVCVCLCSSFGFISISSRLFLPRNQEPLLQSREWLLLGSWWHYTNSYQAVLPNG